MSTTTWIVLGVIAVLIVWVIVIYNGLVAMRQRVNQSFSDVDVQLRQRHDLIPNLVETVKGYATHERGTLEDVIKARNAAMSAQGPAQQGAAEGMLTGALGKIIALARASSTCFSSPSTFSCHVTPLPRCGLISRSKYSHESGSTLPARTSGTPIRRATSIAMCCPLLGEIRASWKRKLCFSSGFVMGL